MRLGMTLGVVSLCLLSTGCRLACDVTRNVIFETQLCCDKVTSKVYYRHLANQAWKQYCGGHPEQAKANAFGQGFRAGYADYLEGGGPVGCAPPLPPQCFWKCKYQNPEGRATTSAWFAGFKEGTAAAKASGYRDYVTVPIGKCDPPRPPGPAPALPALKADVTPVTPPELRPGTSALPTPVAPVAPLPESELPTPRQVPAPPGTAPGGSSLPSGPQGPEVSQRPTSPAPTPTAQNSPAAPVGGPTTPGSAGGVPALMLPAAASPPVRPLGGTEATLALPNPEKGTGLQAPLPVMPAQLPAGGGEATITVSPSGNSLTPWTAPGSGSGG